MNVGIRTTILAKANIVTRKIRNTNGKRAFQKFVNEIKFVHLNSINLYFLGLCDTIINK